MFIVLLVASREKENVTPIQSLSYKSFSFSVLVVCQFRVEVLRFSVFGIEGAPVCRERWKSYYILLYKNILQNIAEHMLQEAILYCSIMQYKIT